MVADTSEYRLHVCAWHLHKVIQVDTNRLIHVCTLYMYVLEGAMTAHVTLCYGTLRYVRPSIPCSKNKSIFDVFVQVI